MHRRTFLVAGVTFASTLLAQTDSAKLDVDVSYTGSGTVDDSHQIYVLVWDTPDFAKGEVPPVGTQTIASKSATAHFDNLQKGAVYLTMVFDSTGTWDAASPPPSGSPVGMYSTEAGQPAPVTLDSGKTTKISAKFDDSYKMP
jgi:hypothetical protein